VWTSRAARISGCPTPRYRCRTSYNEEAANFNAYATSPGEGDLVLALALRFPNAHACAWHRIHSASSGGGVRPITAGAVAPPSSRAAMACRKSAGASLGPPYGVAYLALRPTWLLIGIGLG
jgi:hypothetical protein